MTHVPVCSSSPVYLEDDGTLVYDKVLTSYLGVQHVFLYITLVDDNQSFKNGDWILEKGFIVNEYPDYLTDLDECKLIIASNDTNIGVDEISDELILEYCKNYNKKLNL